MLWEVTAQGPAGHSRQTLPGGQHSGSHGDRGFSIPHRIPEAPPGPGGRGQDSNFPQVHGAGMSPPAQSVQPA